MTNYFSTFITGFSEVVGDALKKSLIAVEVGLLLDGLVVYRTATSAREIRKLRFFNNSFVLIKQFGKMPVGSLDSLFRQVVQGAGLEEFLAGYRFEKGTTFRIVLSHENRMVTANRKLLKSLERKIVKSSVLVPYPVKPEVEFWFLIRRESPAFFGLRITGRKKSPARGGLRPELAHLLCLVSEPGLEDVFLDPFAGSGSIPAERARSFPYRRILVGDSDSKQIEFLRERFKRLKLENVAIGCWDALNLKTFEDGSVDKIVTDPPWGFYRAESLDFTEFYGQMLREFYRILRPGGLAVVLIAKKDVFEGVLSALSPGFKLLKKYDILVSGKKAGIYKLGKY